MKPINGHLNLCISCKVLRSCRGDRESRISSPRVCLWSVKLLQSKQGLNKSTSLSTCSRHWQGEMHLNSEVLYLCTGSLWIRKHFESSYPPANCISESVPWIFLKVPMRMAFLSAQLHWLLLSQISISPQDLRMVCVDSVEKGNKGKSLFNEEWGIH